MANEIRIVIKAVDQASSQISKIGTDAQASMAVVRTSAALALTSIAAIGGAAIKFGSDLNEARNAMRVTFGESSKVVEEFGKTSASSYGLATAQAFQYAAAVGGIAKASGLSKDEAAKMAVSVEKLAVDLGSLRNLDTDVALEKIRSGLVGEAEPLRAVGVLLTENAVKQEALTLGLVKYGEELTEGQKVQARWSLIQKQLSDAAGDFGRTLGESLPNQSKKMQAELTNALAHIGEALLPLALAVTKAVAEIVDAFSKIPVPVQVAALGVGAFVSIAALIAPTLVPAMAAVWGLTTAVVANTAAFAANPLALAAAAAALVVVGEGYAAYKTLSEAAAEAGTTFSHSAEQAMKEGADATRARIADYEELKAALEADIETFRAQGQTTSDLEKQVSLLDSSINEMRDSLNASTSDLGAQAGALANAAGATDTLTAAQQKLRQAYEDTLTAQAKGRSDALARLFPNSEEGAGLGAPGDFQAATGADAVAILQQASEAAAARNRELATALSGGSSAAKEMTDAEKSLEDARRSLAQATRDIGQSFQDEEIAAYLEGGAAKLALVQAEHAAEGDAIKAVAADLMKVFGITLPEALGKAFAHVEGAAKAAAAASEQLSKSLLDLFSNQFLGKKIAPGAQGAIAQFFPGVQFGPNGEASLPGGLNIPKFANGGVVPGTGPQLAVVHGGETVVPAGAGFGTINITVNAGVGDPVQIGYEIAAMLNRAGLAAGPILNSGVVGA